MSKFAWVTLTTNDTYSLGALVLAHSLKRAGTVHQLAVLVTPGVSESMRNKLKDVYNVVQEVNVMDSQDAANLALLARPELGITFTKLHCWRLMQFEKCVFLDSDTLVLQNCDELFEREELSAAPDVSWPDCFNSGVFVYKPSLETFAKITEFALKHGSFDGGDQGLLNSYFADWAHTDIKKHLPFVYNVAAYASYCYLPAFKQFRDKIKILHFAGKMKPWLIQFNSQTRTACTPTDYAHAADLIQFWWNIFCDNVHQKLTDSMKYWPTVVQWVYFHHNHTHNDQSNQDHYESQQQQQQQQQQQYEIYNEVKEHHDPWEDYYENLERQSNEQNTCQQHESKSENVEQSHEERHINVEAQSSDERGVEPFEKVPEFSNQDNYYVYNEQSNNNNDNNNNSNNNNADSSNDNDNYKNTPEYSNKNNNNNNNNNNTNYNKTLEAHEIQEAQHHVHIVTQESSTNYEKDNRNTTNTTVYSVEHVHTEHSTGDDDNDDDDNRDGDYENTNDEAGLAGALSQLRLGEQRTPEQEAYEQLMRRQCWESGQIDYSGKDSFENIWKRITQTLDEKPASSVPKQDDQTEFLTSADIEDGKKEYDPVTKATTVYKVIEGGYEMKITTPQPNGTLKTEVKTFWDPKPCSEEDMKNEQVNKKLIKSRIGKEIRIDRNTTMLTREIEGGYEEVYTTVNEDGTKSMRTKTFFDSVPQELNEQTKTTVQKQNKATNKKQISKVSSVDSTDSTESRRVVQKVQQQRNVSQNVQNQQGKYTEESTIEETRRVTQNIEITENNRTVRKNSLQEQSMKAITSSNTSDNKDGKKKKKTKSIPPPPADFIQNDTTKIVSKRVPGGVEYTYSTQLESGKTITTSKTVYEEEEVELTEEEIKQYKKTLKDAEKHKNLTTTKKLRSESGTKKVVPSENPGDVTTVETIKIQGGTEYHYTTVTPEGIVKKAVKTVYDPVPTTKSTEDETDEEEIIEEYEEEIIEPGEKNVKTIETVQKLPQKFEEEVTITHEKKEKKVKKSMMISH